MCNEERCKDGHNLDGICRMYNSKEGCFKGSRYCRFLHIKVKTTERKEKRGEDEQRRRTSAEKDKPRSEREEEERKGDEREDELQETREPRTNEYLNVGEVYYDEEYQQEMESIKNYYPEEDEQESRERKVDDDEREESGEDGMIERHVGMKKKQDIGNHEIKNERRAPSNDREARKQVDRDLKSFLMIDSKHDVWKLIKGTKAEIKMLRREIKEGKRKYEDQSQ